MFKGGTSLFKAFAIIERFSEDIDVLVDTDWTGNQRKTLLRATTSPTTKHRPQARSSGSPPWKSTNYPTSPGARGLRISTRPVTGSVYLPRRSYVYDVRRSLGG